MGLLSRGMTPAQFLTQLEQLDASCSAGCDRSKCIRGLKIRYRGFTIQISARAKRNWNKTGEHKNGQNSCDRSTLGNVVNDPGFANRSRY